MAPGAQGTVLFHTLERHSNRIVYSGDLVELVFNSPPFHSVTGYKPGQPDEDTS